MSEQVSSPEEIRHAMDGFWIQNNIAFLARYWRTATEALKRVAADPDGITEFEGNTLGPNYVEAVVGNHLDHHNDAGVLLTYATFDEFMVVLTRNLGEVRDARITASDLRDRGVRRYKKFIHQVCRVPADGDGIDWSLLQDMTVVRNAIIHANGNRSLVNNRRELEAVVARRSPKLSFKHQSRLVVANEFVLDCMSAVREAALSIHTLAAPAGSSNEGRGWPQRRGVHQTGRFRLRVGASTSREDPDEWTPSGSSFVVEPGL